MFVKVRGRIYFYPNSKSHFGVYSGCAALKRFSLFIPGHAHAHGSSLTDVTVDRCKNSSIQQGRRKVLFSPIRCQRLPPSDLGLQKTEVKATDRCGLGLFLTEPAQEGELMTGVYLRGPETFIHDFWSLPAEYVGELVLEPTTQSRECVISILVDVYLTIRISFPPVRCPNTVGGTIFSVSTCYSPSTARMSGTNHDTLTTHGSMPTQRREVLFPCLFSLFLITDSCLVLNVNGEHRIGIYACERSSCLFRHFTVDFPKL